MNRIIKLDYIAKIEGHASLSIKATKDSVEKVQMEVFEGARYFEAILLGRHFRDVPDIASRICGICSQSHLLNAIKAIEKCLGVEVSPQTSKLRKLMMMASVLQSHVLHLYFLALPDYVKCDSAVDMARKRMDDVKQGLELKKLANEIVTVIGGRKIHSVRCDIGGFSKLPEKEELDRILKELKKAKDDIMYTAELFSGLDYPNFTRDAQHLCLKQNSRFDWMSGRVISNRKLNIKPEDYEKHIKEKAVAYSTAKTVTVKDSGFMVGALPRINMNKEALSKDASKALRKSKLKLPSYNPYHNNIAQAIECVHLADSCIDILEGLKLKEEEPVKIKNKAGRGIAIAEAPRGLLVHDYKLDAKGRIKASNIISPTTLNLKNIEEDVTELLPGILKKSDRFITAHLEKLIRAYDPCISCSSHFLKIKWL